ncbi:MAG: VCBS repeat-containing protein [Acidimicrobiales bacterium]|nr:VCBS repeat-containing protein [Acidimicrobiales bacterium]
MALVAAAALAAPAGAQEGPGPETTTTGVEAPPAPTTTRPPGDPGEPGDVPVAPGVDLAEAEPVPAGPEGARAISGTIRGVDGRFVNAQISLVLRRADGTFIGLNGQPSAPGAYAATVSMNPGVPLEGVESGGDETWAFRGIPANAHDFTFEVYPRGPGFPQGNWSHYGGAAKRRVVIPAGGLANVRLRLPLNCDQPGGTTGSIRVRNSVDRRPSGNLDNFLALSESRPPSGIQGFRAAGTIPAGDATPRFDGLAPHQRYSVNVYTPGPRLHAFYEVPVHACRTTTVYSYVGSPTKPPRWTRLGTRESGVFFPLVGEFTGDRFDDVFWYAPAAAGDKLATSTGDGTTFRYQTRSVGPGYRPVSGDWNGDGISDIFWYGPGAARDRIWRGQPGGSFRSLPATAGGSTSTWPVAGDFDGNGHTDILFAVGGRLSTLRRYRADGYVNGSATVPANSQVRAGDVNGDFRDDLVWHNPSTGAVQVWFGRADGTFAKVNEVVGRGVGYRPILADLSGDFRADLLWYAPGPQPDRLWRGRASSSPFFAKESADLGITASYQPFAGDWNGDGTEDVFWYAPGAAADVMWRQNLSGWIPQH